MSKDLEYFCCREFVTKLYIVGLSTWIGMASYGYPSFLIVIQSTTLFWQLRYNVNISYLATNPMMN